MQNNIEY